MIASPSGTAVGMSLAECTATSMRPSSSAVSSSLVKRPLSPILASGASSSLSPLVLMISISTREVRVALRHAVADPLRLHEGEAGAAGADADQVSERCSSGAPLDSLATPAVHASSVPVPRR